MEYVSPRLTKRNKAIIFPVSWPSQCLTVKSHQKTIFKTPWNKWEEMAHPSQNIYSLKVAVFSQWVSVVNKNELGAKI